MHYGRNGDRRLAHAQMTKLLKICVKAVAREGFPRAARSAAAERPIQRIG